MTPNILLTICARGGSKGVKGKNIRELNGKPLIYYTIKQAKEWGKAKNIVVSTDSEEIACIAKKYGVDIPFLRPAELASDIAPKFPVLRHALRKSEELFKSKYDIVVDLDVTSPIRTITDLDNCLDIFLKYKPETLFSVIQSHKNPYFNMVEENPDNTVALCKKLPSNVYRRQDAPRVYDMNASIYFYRRDYVNSEENNSVFSKKSLIYVMDDFKSIDIDEELDFKFVEFLIKEGVVIL
jgi:CMP-N-acetylneuraminic acid synthetase